MPKARKKFPDDELRRRVAGNLARLIEERGMDERNLAVSLGWTKTSEAHGAADVRKYLRGEAYPREKLQLRIAEALGAGCGVCSLARRPSGGARTTRIPISDDYFCRCGPRTPEHGDHVLE